MSNNLEDMRGDLDDMDSRLTHVRNALTSAGCRDLDLEKNLVISLSDQVQELADARNAAVAENARLRAELKRVREAAEPAIFSGPLHKSDKVKKALSGRSHRLSAYVTSGCFDATSWLAADLDTLTRLAAHLLGVNGYNNYLWESGRSAPTIVWCNSAHEPRWSLFDGVSPIGVFLADCSEETLGSTKKLGWKNVTYPIIQIPALADFTSQRQSVGAVTEIVRYLISDDGSGK